MGQRRPALDVRPFTRTLSCDVAIVGAGISGALIAEMLSEAGLDIVILDRRGPAIGSTAASTALLQYELDVPLSVMAERIGRDRATRIWRRSRLAVDSLRERTERLGLRVDAATRPSLYLDGNLLDRDGLAAEAQARRDAGFEIELIGPAEVDRRYGIRRRHGIVGFGNYSADPRQMAAAYLRTAQTRGARLYAPAEVSGVEVSDSGVTLAIGERANCALRKRYSRPDMKC
jgi:glycine/D-amino acid oxidase-like deaminating enzyme